MVEGARIRVEFPITDGRIIGQGRRKQPLHADYVLEYRSKRLAIVEAKARDSGYTDGVGQAKDYTEPQLEDLRKLVHGEESDLFDVLNYVAYQKDLVPRLDRAEQAKIQINDYDPNQQAFLNFVLAQYVKEGVSELDDAKLADLLKLNYGTIDDAKNQLGPIKEIRKTFIGFQEHLYEQKVS